MKPQVGDIATIKIGERYAMGIIKAVEDETYCRIGDGLRIYCDDIVRIVRIKEAQ